MTKDVAASDAPDRFHELMMKALDGELNSAEEEEFQGLLAQSEESRREWNHYQRLKEATMKMKFAEPPDEVWDRYWLGIYNRLERRLAWVLVSIGAMILLFFGGYKAIESILQDPHLPGLIKFAILALVAGGVILFVSVLREKLFTRKTDKYREIQR